MKLIVGSVGVGVVVVAALAYSEEYLVKDGDQRFLGKSLKDGTFVTCLGSKLQVGMNKLEQTDERCPEQSSQGARRGPGPAGKKPNPFKFPDGAKPTR